jgi:hypothetical protein
MRARRLLYLVREFWTNLTQLKVHKNENFFDFNFEFCTISMLVIHKKEDFSEKFF